MTMLEQDMTQSGSAGRADGLARTRLKLPLAPSLERRRLQSYLVAREKR